MIMNADVRHVWQHSVNGSTSSGFDQAVVTEGIAGKNQAAVLKALCPFGPATSRVLAVDCKYGGAELYVPTTVQGCSFLSRELEYAICCWKQTSRGYVMIDEHRIIIATDATSVMASTDGGCSLQVTACRPDRRALDR